MDEIKNVDFTNEKKVIKIKKWWLIGFIILIPIVLIILWWLSAFRGDIAGMRGDVIVRAPTLSRDSRNYESGPAYSTGYSNSGSDSSIKDTREFLKTSYEADIKTRKVIKVVNDVKNIIKGADGRIDSIQSGEKHGSVRFVVPKSKFESFKDEVAAITNAKLYTENINSKNLLQDKQYIELLTANATETLASLRKEKQDLDNSHADIVKQLNTSISNLNSQIKIIRNKISVATDTNIISSLNSNLNSLNQSLSNEKITLSSENNNYYNNNSNLQLQIQSAEQNLTNVNKQDTNFNNNIETVEGYIYVNWVSIWDLAVIFFPIHPIIIIIILVILLLYFLKRKNYIPKVELV